MNQLALELGRQVEAVNSGDLRRAEGMLISQAHALQELFVHLARRATKREYLKKWDAYMRMAMKAQNQCRMTLESLAAIKNPPVVFARQANFNNGGQQQVNNGTPPPRATPNHAHAARSQNPPIELLEATDVQRLDTGAESASGGADQGLAPLVEVDGPTHR